MNFSQKAKNIEPSLTLEITAMANKMKEDGIDVISFSAGEPDFNTPENIIARAYEAMKAGKTKYTPTTGILPLKKAITEKLYRDNNLSYNTDQIIVCNGAKQCLANIFLALLNEGEEVLIPKPYWVTYPELVKLAGGKPVFVDTDKKNKYKFKVEDLKKYISSKTKAIIINSPNNPTGTVYTKEELTEIAEFAKQQDLFIISDEIYEKLIYGETEHISIASLSEDAYKRTVVINGVSKAYAMTGWRIGYCAASKELVSLMNSIQSHFTSNPNSIAQYASVEALTGPQHTVELMKAEFEKRRDFAVERLSQIDNISYIRPEGAFYVMINVSALYGKKIGDISVKDSLEFAKMLLESEKVAAVPGVAFGFDDYIRISYATSMNNLEKGLNRLENFIKGLK